MYQLTAIDTATRWAFIMIVLGTPNGTITARFVHHMIRHYRGSVSPCGRCSPTTVPNIERPRSPTRSPRSNCVIERIPARSPNHNAVCERFQGTALQECWRPAFHRRRFSEHPSTPSRDRRWLIHYNTRRRNHSDYMHGRTPRQVLDTHRKNKAA